MEKHLSRGLIVVMATSMLLMGCGVSRELYRAQQVETERVESLRRQEQERAEALQSQVLQLLRTIEVLLEERDRLAKKVGSLESTLTESETARLELLQLNAELMGQRARLSQLTQQLSDTWYDSALDRARRALSPEPPEPVLESEAAPAPEPVPPPETTP